MPVIGLVIGLMLVSPSLPNAYSVADPNSDVQAVMAFGSIPIVGCQGSVLTAILTAFIGATLEKKLRKVMPNALDLIMTPFVVMLVTFLVVILGIKSNSYGPAVLPSYLMYIYEWRQLFWYFIISVASVATCFVLTSMFAIPEEVLVEE